MYTAMRVPLQKGTLVFALEVTYSADSTGQEMMDMRSRLLARGCLSPCWPHLLPLELSLLYELGNKVLQIFGERPEYEN